jgi:hypothetical protein
MKEQCKAEQNKPLFGCNECLLRHPVSGKTLFKAVHNSSLLYLTDPNKCKYDKKKAEEDWKKSNIILEQYSKLKKICNFDRELFIPQHLYNKQHIMFYGRFECGNLLRVIKKAPRAEIKTFTGLTVSDVEKRK